MAYSASSLRRIETLLRATALSKLRLLPSEKGLNLFPMKGIVIHHCPGPLKECILLFWHFLCFDNL